MQRSVIVELKRGGFEIGRKERQQPLDYASEIRKSGKVQKTTKITGFVLGTTIATDAADLVREGDNTKIFPRTYSTVLRAAHARTFNLRKRLEEIRSNNDFVDQDVEMVVNSPEQQPMFDAQAVV